MIRINLLEEKKKEKKEVRLKLSPFVLTAVVAGVVFVLMGITAFYLLSEVSQLKSRIETNKEILAALSKKINEVKRYEKLNKEIEHRSSIIESLRRHQSIPVKMIDDVSAMIPKGAWLSSMTHKGNAIALEGYAFTNIAIVHYVRNLKGSENFTEVYLEESRQVEVENVKVYRFKLNFIIRA